MKKIKSLEDSEKERKRNVKILSIIMLVILLSSTLGFAFSFGGFLNNNQENSEQQENNLDNFVLSYTEDEVKEIKTIPGLNVNDYLGRPLYIDSNSSGVVINELAMALSSKALRIQEACYGSCEKNLPEKDCSENLIIYRKSEQHKIFKEENCIFIEGDIKTVDAFIYSLFRWFWIDNKV